jgi:hypothetical protein
MAKVKEVRETSKEAIATNIVISRPKVLSTYLEIMGTAPMIQNNFSQKAIEEMLRKHMGITVQREKKVPRQVLENATIYNVKGEICFPPTALKKAMLTASVAVKGLKKTQLRASIFIEGGSIPFTYERMVPRMDMVRTSGMGRTPDVRFRPMFEGWKARFGIQFSETLLDIQTVVDLVQRAGMGGIGEWRPEKDGNFGTFVVSRAITEGKEIAEIRDLCAPSLKPLVIPEWAMDAGIDSTTLSKLFGDQEEEEEAPQKKHG